MPSATCAKPYTPRDYQITAIKFLLEHACAGLLLAPGLGKTSSTLAAIAFLKKRNMIGKTLIIAPLRPCYTVWPREIKKWLDFNHLTIEILHGPGKDAALKRDADIYVINPDGLEWLLGITKQKVKRMSKGRDGKLVEVERTEVKVDHKRVKQLGFDVLVVDELSMFKHHTTNRFKAMKEVLNYFSRRWGLTGSPASNGLMDLFGQCYILDQGDALSPYITRFREKYFVPDKYGYDWKIKEDGAEKIYEAIAPLMLRMGTELLDMPELIYNVIPVEVPSAAREIYDALEEDFITALESRIVSAPTAAAASTKLRQVANGAVFLDREILSSGLLMPKSKREWAELHTSKIEALADLISELQGAPLLVAYDFEHDLARLRQAFPKATFAADYNMKQFPELEDRWNRGEIPVLFGHPQSIGHGLNLQGTAQHVAWFSLTWNFELFEQFVGRVWRQGNEHLKVFVHFLLAEGTIDDVIYGIIQTKDSTQEALFNGLKALAAQRRNR